MPFTITTTTTGVFTKDTKKFAVAHIKISQLALLYGVEVSCQNGFTADPTADIYVFNNPQAAKDFVEDIDSTFDWEGNGLKSGLTESRSDIPGSYIVTYARATFDTNFTKMPLGITGCRYSDHPKPFFTNTEKGFAQRETYLTIVVVFNTGSNVSDESALIRGIFESA